MLQVLSLGDVFCGLVLGFELDSNSGIEEVSKHFDVTLGFYEHNMLLFELFQKLNEKVPSDRPKIDDVINDIAIREFR